LRWKGIGRDDNVHLESADFVLTPCLAAVGLFTTSQMDGLGCDLLGFEFARDFEGIHSIIDILAFTIFKHRGQIFPRLTDSIWWCFKSQQSFRRLDPATSSVVGLQHDLQEDFNGASVHMLLQCQYPGIYGHKPKLSQISQSNFPLYFNVLIIIACP